MSSNSKKAVAIALIGMVVFGIAAQWLSNRQTKAKADLIAFLRNECGVETVLVNDKGGITHEALAAVRRDLGDWRDAEKRTLWERFRYCDYWLSVCRTLFAVGLFILFFVMARTLLGKITVSKRIYGKFRTLEEVADKPDGAEKKP
jgi:hypothetical protein